MIVFSMVVLKLFKLSRFTLFLKEAQLLHTQIDVTDVTYSSVDHNSVVCGSICTFFTVLPPEFDKKNHF